jgi:hypothetical protein
MLVLIIFNSCSKNPVKEQPIPKMVPDHTPYIAGFVEASPDTTPHYSQIVVGYFTDTQNLHDPGILLSRHYPGIYSPMLIKQLLGTSILFALSWQPESNAVVKVSGPLGAPKEKKVTFTSEGKGIYGDVNYMLPRVTNGQYQLHVTLPDGRTYVSKTHIPGAIILPLPDSISIKVKYWPLGNGEPNEKDVKRYVLPFKAPENSFLRVLQFNSSVDRQLLLLKPNQHFRFADRGNYLRVGIGYNVELVNSIKKEEITRPWGQFLNKPRDKIWNMEHWWYHVSFFSKGLGRMFFNVPNWTTTNEKTSQFQYLTSVAKSSNDSTFLFRASTIREVGKNGNVLLKDSSDAIGFFVGVSSRYEQTTLYPIRQYNLDSVWTAWNKRNN